MTVQEFRLRTTKFPSRGNHSFYYITKEFKHFRSSTPAFTATTTEFGEGSSTIRNYLANKGKLEVSSPPPIASAD